MKVAALTLAAGFTTGCPGSERPNLDFVLAREAFNSATDVDSAKYAPANYHRAEESYRRAMRLYESRSYREASEEFRTARIYAERAELASRIQRQKAGEEGL